MNFKQVYKNFTLIKFLIVLALLKHSLVGLSGAQVTHTKTQPKPITSRDLFRLLKSTDGDNFHQFFTFCIRIVHFNIAINPRERIIELDKQQNINKKYWVTRSYNFTLPETNDCSAYINACKRALFRVPLRLPLVTLPNALQAIKACHDLAFALGCDLNNESKPYPDFLVVFTLCFNS